MAKWISCGDGFIPADVIRWTEAVWERRSRRKNAKAVNTGQRMVTAEVVREDAEGCVCLLVRACETLSEKPGRKVYPLPLHQEIRLGPAAACAMTCEQSRRRCSSPTISVQPSA